MMLSLPRCPVDIGGDDEASLHVLNILLLQQQLLRPPADRRPGNTRQAARQFQQSSIDSPGDTAYTVPVPVTAHRGMHNASLGCNMHELAVQTHSAAQDAARAHTVAAFAARGSQDDVLVARRMQVRAARPVRERPESAI